LLLALAAAFAALALFAAEARADSFDHRPPKGVLMKDGKTLQAQVFAGGEWSWYIGGEPATAYFDNFGSYHFPYPDRVGPGTTLHVRFAKPQRPHAVHVNAYPRVKDATFGGKSPAGEKQQLETTLSPVKQLGKIVAWNVNFRVGESERDYYLIVHSVWSPVAGTRTSYGNANYAFHVKTN